MSSGSPARVRFLGQRDDVPRLLEGRGHLLPAERSRRARSVSVSSKRSAAGLPVITADLGAAPEIVDDSCGVLVEPGSVLALTAALKRLIEAGGERGKMSAGARRRAREFCDLPRSPRPAGRRARSTLATHTGTDMTTILFCVAAFVLCLVAANRSLRYGLLAVIGGRLQLRHPARELPRHLDLPHVRRRRCSGCTSDSCGARSTPEQRRQAHDLRLWLVVLIAWPALLFFLFPTDSPLVELVGLRANIFLLPFLLLGTRLTRTTSSGWRWALAALNVAAVGVGVAEFFLGIQPFYPQNEVTDIIYRSKDLVGWTAHRIPATFSSAHAFAGTMVMTLPLLIGCWVADAATRSAGTGTCSALAIVASLLGVFMAAARTHMLTASLLVAIVTFSGTFAEISGCAGSSRWRSSATSSPAKSGSSDSRRCRTPNFIAERWTGSVNEGFFEAIRAYPLGNGLAGGGTSVPYFLRGKQSPLMHGERVRADRHRAGPARA